ncbi:MAG: leucine-rich repeat domain-containing protein [Candidatus Lokiarchaeota archaeon]|nr:leucine-rich repeat domain-containing protein [Candidatus Lokiarchaeota archaeon]
MSIMETIMKRQFQINKLIVLKLEEGVTNIYLNGEKFIQCKFLITDIPITELEHVHNSKSIDELFGNQNLDLEYDKVKYKIAPEVEFWAHCSNLQAWAESGYDTRLLLSNLSFPLLKKLAQLGDIHAKRVLKEEVAKRISTGYNPVIQFLVMESYTELLNIEELEIAIKDLKEFNLYRCNLKKIPDFILKGKKLQNLILSENRIEQLDERLGKLKFLTKLYLNDNHIEYLPTTIGNLINLKELNLRRNKLKFLPESLYNLSNLKKLDLSVNRFKKFPENVCNIISLENLNLSKNQIKIIPHSIVSLINLKCLTLNQNKLNRLPDNIGMLDSLVWLLIDGNNLKELPETIKNLKSLKYLYIDGNNLEEIPNFLGDIKLLKELRVDNILTDLINRDLKEKLNKRNVNLTVVKNKTIIRQWTAPNKYNSKNPYRIILFSDNTWTCTCPHQKFKMFLKLKTDCEHITDLKKNN